MASIKAIGTALKMMGRAFAGVVDDAKIEVYAAALEDLSDESLATATALLIKTHAGEFIPTPAAIRTAAGANRPPAVDAAAILRQIEKLAVYNPAAGMIYPQAVKVRDELGEAIAYAYASAGASRLFTENDVSRDIATREFQRALTDIAQRPGDYPLIAAPSLRQLPS